ncbi:hypothetical protein C0J52_13706, partial [Blattella germanica]
FFTSLQVKSKGKYHCALAHSPFLLYALLSIRHFTTLVHQKQHSDTPVKNDDFCTISSIVDILLSSDNLLETFRTIFLHFRLRFSPLLFCLKYRTGERNIPLVDDAMLTTVQASQLKIFSMILQNYQFTHKTVILMYKKVLKYINLTDISFKITFLEISST